jgi:hypothetical protein
VWSGRVGILSAGGDRFRPRIELHAVKIDDFSHRVCP